MNEGSSDQVHGFEPGSSGAIAAVYYLARWAEKLWNEDRERFRDGTLANLAIFNHFKKHFDFPVPRESLRYRDMREWLIWFSNNFGVPGSPTYEQWVTRDLFVDESVLPHDVTHRRHR